MYQQRIAYLDYAKGVGILFVILAHIYAWNPYIQNDAIVVWIYSFHMPLFFIISGILIRYRYPKNISTFIISKLKHILIPYFIFSLFSALFKFILYGVNWPVFYQDIQNTITLAGVDMWFLQALFFAEIMFVLIVQFCENKLLREIILSLLFILSLLATKEYGTLVQFWARVGVSIWFVSIGYHLFPMLDKINLSIPSLLTIMTFQLFLSILNGFVDLNNLVFNNKLLYIINSLLGSISLLLLLKKLNSNIRILSYFGANSLVMFVTHNNIIYFTREFISPNFHGYYTGFILFLVILIVETILIKIINLYFPWMLGKRKSC